MFIVYFRPPTASSNAADAKKDKGPPVEVPDTVVLLADCLLLELPLEALDIFESPSISSMSRDLSLQMIYHRYHQEQLTRRFSHLWQIAFPFVTACKSKILDSTSDV